MDIYIDDPLRPGNNILDIDGLLASAREQSGLENFGDPWFMEPLAVLINAVGQEAELSPNGLLAQRAGIVDNLVNRLRMVDVLQRHPEIEDVQLNVAAVILGLPRTGSTLLQRMLTSAPDVTAVRWWETWNYVPFPDEPLGNPFRRLAFAEEKLAQMISAAPDLMSIHDFGVRSYDEEIKVLDSLFIGTISESWMHVPSFARWLLSADQAPAYRDFKRILKILQWQDPHRKNCKWILKTPSHMTALRFLVEEFPDPVLVMTHRDPLQTIPSLCSFSYSLFHLFADNVDPVKIGSFIEKRMAEILNRFCTQREEFGDRRFMDVRYEDLVSNPINVGKRIFERAGIEFRPETAAAMSGWLTENSKENALPHRYSLDQFSLDADTIRDDFAAYRSRFINGLDCTR
jgi:hypothetical protein